MELSQLTPAALTELIQLIEEKQTLRTQIERVEASMQAIIAGTTPPAIAKAPRAAKPAPAWETAAPASKKPAAPAGRAKRGALKEGILAALQTAGAEGLAVTDLAAKLGFEPANVHVWFSTTGKKIAEITKVSAGRYAYAATGTVVAAAQPVADMITPAPEIFDAPAPTEPEATTPEIPDEPAAPELQSAPAAELEPAAAEVPSTVEETPILEETAPIEPEAPEVVESTVELDPEATTEEEKETPAKSDEFQLSS